MSKDTRFSFSRINAAKNYTDKHQERLNILKKLDKNKTLTADEINSIAGLNYNDMKGVATIMEDSLMALGQFTEKKPSKYADDTVIGQKVYSNLHKAGYLDFFRGDTSNLVKTQSGKDLMNKTVRNVINNINYNKTTRQGMADFQDVYAGINNFADIMKHGGQVVSYDLETLGGTNARGHQQVDFITEFAAMVHDIAPDGSYKINEKKSMATLAGFSEEEYNHVKNYIKSLDGKTPGQLSSKDNIYLKRLSLLSDPTFAYKQNSLNGFEFRVSHAEPENVVSSVDNALRGLEEYRKIGVQQEAWLKAQGINKSLKDYKYEYANKVSALVHGHEGLNGNAVSLAHNSFIFDDPMFGMTLGKNIEHSFGKGVDSLQAMRYIQEYLGIGAHLPQGFQTTNQFGLTTQDQLKTGFGITSEVGAHNAAEDSMALFKIFNKQINDKGETYLDFINKQTKVVNKNLMNLKNNSPIDGLTGRKPIFLMDKTGQKDWSMNKNGLSFSHNPIDGSYTTFDGFRIDANGGVTKQKIPGFGPKAGALYTHEFEEIKLDQANWQEQFKNFGLPEEATEKFYQQYSGLDTLYIMRSKEYQDPKALAAKFGEDAIFEDPSTFVTILTNKNQIATSTGTMVGRINEDGSPAWNYGALNNLNLQTVETENGKIAVKNVTGDEAGKMLLDRSMIRTSAESAARTIREMPYDRAAKLHNYAKDAQHRISQTISQMVAANKTGDIATSTALMTELTQVLGWKDLKTGHNTLRPETIGKTTILDKYTEALGPILDVMEDVFKNDIKIGTDKAAKAKKDIIFNNVLTNVLEQMSGSTSALSNSVAGVFTAEELNKVDFLRGDIFPNLEAQSVIPGVANANSKYVSLDLSKDTGLMNMFYNNQFKDLDLARDSNAGFTALFNAYDTIGADERFKGVWGNLSRKDLYKFQNEKNLIELNHVMTQQIQNFVSDKRVKDSGFGLKFVRNIQDYSNVDNLTAMIKNHSADIRDMVTKEMHASNIDVMMADGTDSKLVNKIVDKYFMTFSKDELNKQIQGMTSNQQQWMKAQYGFNKNTARSTTEDLLNAIKGTDINLGILGSGKDARMFLKQGGRTQFIDMFQFTLNNGVINHRINDVDYASSFSYNVNGILTKNGQLKNKNMSTSDVLDNIRITSNVEEALERTRGFSNTIGDARRRQDDLFDALVYRVKSNNGLLREVGAMKQNNNFSNTMKRAMYINTNPIVGILPELREAGIINQLEKDYNVDNKTSKGFNQLIDKIAKGKFRPHEINSLLANEQNLYFHQYINPLLDAVNRQATNLGNIEDIDLKNLIINTLNPHTQDTKLAAGIMSVDDNAYAHGMAKFDKTGRSVSIQTENQILYERQKLAEDIKKYGLKDVSVGGKLMTSSGDKLLNHNGKFTSGLTMKYLQIDSNNLKNIFVDDVAKAGTGESNRFSEFLKKSYNGLIDEKNGAKVLAEKVMSFSTYQQQSIMDSRAHYVAFHKNNEQIINGKKQLIISHTENVENINATMKAKKLNFKIVDGEIHYDLGYEVKKNDVFGVFGEGTVERAKYTGVFRGRFFDKNGNLVSQDELNRFIKKKKLKDHEILKAVNEEYNFKYQVIKKYDDFGHKIANDASEKSTVDSMDIAFGSIDKHLEHDLNNALGENKIKNLNGRFLSRDYIEQYISPMLKPEDKGLIDRILKEKFSLSDALQEMFPQFKGVQQITSLESSKHESISMAVSNIVEKISNSKTLSRHAEKHYRELFGDNFQIGADGTIITDNIDSINTKVNNKKLQSYLNNRNFVKDDAGNIIGHTGYSHVTQIHDWEGGTYSSNLDISRLKNDRFDIEGKIDALRAKKSLSKNEQTSLDKYISKQALIDQQIGQLSSQKGIKFDNRANLNLNKSVWNNDSLSLTRDNFKDKAEFNKYFGHAMDSTGQISEEYLGNSVLDPVTSVMRKRTLIGFGETRLSAVKGIDKKKYGYLLDSYSSISNKISVEKAEKLYSLQQGVRAIDFNNYKGGFSKSKFNALVNGAEHEYNNFKVLDVSNLRPNDKGWMDLDIGGQGNTITHAANNPYSQNTMLKMRLGDKDEYLAIARMPERHFENNLIKTSHIKKLNQLQNVLKEINSGDLNDADLKSKTDYARTLLGDIKTSQIYDVTSKYGLAGDLNASRLSQSFFGKASSITYNYTKAFGENTYGELKALNGHSFLDKAQFDGKSLLQHYSEGKAIDAVGFSEEAAEDMGYFSHDMMKKAGVNTREDMIKKLSTHGDTFLATRFPRNQEASDKVVMGYLDTSLRGNQIKAVGHTGASMKMDHDGDEFGIGRLTNEKGDSFLTIKNPTDEFITSQKAMLMERAVNDNRYWDQTIRDRVQNVEGKIARSGSSIQDVAKKRIIDNKVYSAIMNSGESATYEKLLNSDFYKPMVDKAMSFKGDGDAHAENIQAIEAKFKGNQAEIQKAKSEYVDAYRYQLYKDEFIAKSSKNSIGESNVTNLKIKQAFMGTADKTAKDFNYKSSLVYNMMYLTEEAAISSKSSIKGLDPDRAKVWNTHAKDLILGNGDAQEHIGAMKKWTKDYVVGDIDYDFYWNKSNEFRSIAAKTLNDGKNLTKAAFDDLMSNSGHKEKMENRLVNDFVDTIASMRGTKNINEAFAYSSVGQSTSGVKSSITKPTILGNSPNVTDELFNAQRSAHKDLNGLMDFLTVSDTVKSSRVSGPNIIDSVVSGAEDLGEKQSLGKAVLEGAHDLFEGVKGSKIAMGAVGIAAGVMMLGYVGGRPRPADTQAMEEANNNDYQEQPGGMMGGLMDPGMMPSTMGGQTGYVVNINARTDRGRSHAISAIQQAISNGTSSSVNIAMNINDNYGNISDRDIQKAIKDAL